MKVDVQYLLLQKGFSVIKELALIAIFVVTGCYAIIFLWMLSEKVFQMTSRPISNSEAFWVGLLVSVFIVLDYYLVKRWLKILDD